MGDRDRKRDGWIENDMSAAGWCMRKGCGRPTQVEVLGQGRPTRVVEREMKEKKKEDKKNIDLE